MFLEPKSKDDFKYTYNVQILWFYIIIMNNIDWVY